MRFNRLDLNLLVALDALLSERNVTRAAERLNLTPSAVSSALARLREFFDDELLVQVGRKMEPTPRAEGLHDAVRDVLVRIDSTIAARPAFDPAATERSFTLLMSDYSQMVLLPHVLAQAAEQRARAHFHVLPQVTSPQRSLERGEADLLIIPEGLTSPDHPHEVLYEESYVCLVARGSALSRGELTLERYAAADHVVMEPSNGSTRSYEGSCAAREGINRHVVASTYSLSVLPALVQGTDFVATVQARLVRMYAGLWAVETRPAPYPLPPMRQAVQWHKYRTQDPGLAWVRGLLKEAVVRMDATSSP